MLKKRLVGVVVVRDGLAVQSFGYRRYLPIGRPEIVVEYLNTWGIDEIAVVDVTATSRGTGANVELVRRLSRFCQVPLTYGGGIRGAADMTLVVRAGADKVMINQAFRVAPEVVAEGARLLGNQCIVVSLDVTRGPGGDLEPYDYFRSSSAGVGVEDLAKRAEASGAGEIFLNAVHRDGGKQGFDLDAARLIASAVAVPVTICGGVGHPQHFAPALEIPNISAVAAANYFNFTEHSVTTTKQFLRSATSVRLRHDGYFDYTDAGFDSSGRIAKKDDAALKEMLFERHPQEVI